MLSDVSLFATLRLASGLPYTRLRNDANGQTGPPSWTGLAGTLIEPVNASRTPMEKRFDVRLVKGLRLLGLQARAFADFRNPLGLTNMDEVWLETGTAENPAHREDFVHGLLTQSTLDGDASIDDFDILREADDTNPVNIYMLQEAERRFGNGNGVFTVAEQRRMLNDWYDLLNGTQYFRETNRSLRLGFELVL